MDGRVSKSNLKNFRTNRPAVNSPKPSTQVPTPSKPAVAPSVPSTASSSTPSKPVPGPAPVAVTKDLEPKTSSNAGLSPGQKAPTTSALLKQLNAAQATLKANQATRPAQIGTQRVVPSPQRMATSMPTMTAAKLPTVPVTHRVPPFSYPTPTTSSPTTLPPSTAQQPSINAAPPPSVQRIPSLNLSDRLSMVYPHPLYSNAQAYDPRAPVVPSSAEQITQTMFQRFAPVLASIDTRQIATVNQLMKLELMTHDLGVKEKDREAKELEREERDKGLLKALLLVADKATNIEAAIALEGTSRTALSDRLGKLEMNLEECLERLRDPKADGMDVDEAPAAPATPVVRRDMAVSPIMRPVPIATTYASVQVGTSPVPTFVNVLDTQASSKDIGRSLTSPLSELSSSNECLGAEPDPTKAIGASAGGGGVDANSTDNNNQAKEPLSFATPIQQQHRNDGPATPTTQTPRSGHLKPTIAPVGSLSPVDWSKPIASSSVRKNPTGGVAVSSPHVAGDALKYQRSYVLPAMPEGTVAALRKALGDPYPYPVPSITLGAGASVPSGKEPVVAPHLRTLFDVLPTAPEEEEGEDDEEEEEEEEEEDQLVDDATESKPIPNPEPEPQNDPSPSKSHGSGVTEDENAVVRSLVMDERAVVNSSDPIIIQDVRDVNDSPPSPPASSVNVQSSKVGQSLVNSHRGSSGPKGKSIMDAEAIFSYEQSVALLFDSPSPPAIAHSGGAVSKPSLLPSSTSGEHHEIKKDGVRNEEGSSSSSQIPSAGKIFPEVTTAAGEGEDSSLSSVELDFLFQSPAKKVEKKKGKKRERSLSVITISSDSDFPTTVRSKKHASTTSGTRGTTSVKKGEASSRPTATAAAGSVSVLSPPRREKRPNEAKNSSVLAILQRKKMHKQLASFNPTTSESELTSTTPTPTHATSEVARFKKLMASLYDDDDDDVEVVPVKRHKASIRLSASGSTSKVEKTSNDSSATTTTKATKKATGVVSSSNSSAVPEIKIPEKGKIASPPGKIEFVGLSDRPKRRRGPSVAVTRVKKRKAPEEGYADGDDDDDDGEGGDVFGQPPLKRAKLKVKNKTLERTTPPPTTTKANEMPSGSGSKSKSKSTDGNGNGSNKPFSVVQWEPAAGSSSGTPTKRIRGSQPRAASVLWPKMDKPTFEQFIECDICDRWYHVGCVGLHPSDVRLSGSESYHCPPCKAGSHKDALSPEKNKTSSAVADCSRPKCLRPIVKSNASEGDTYIVEAFVGMRKKSVGGRGLQIQYLVKWFGYGYRDATWETEHRMGLPNSGVFIEKFEKAAKKEKLDISQCNQEAVVLECAAQAGWNAQGLYIAK